MTLTVRQKQKRKTARNRVQRCAYCGCQLTKANRSIDHVIPTAAGGPDHPSNWKICCKPCNSRKGDSRVVPDYRSAT